MKNKRIRVNRLHYPTKCKLTLGDKILLRNSFVADAVADLGGAEVDWAETQGSVPKGSTSKSENLL